MYMRGGRAGLARWGLVRKEGSNVIDVIDDAFDDSTEVLLG
jgi:hypothetical protein